MMTIIESILSKLPSLQPKSQSTPCFTVNCKNRLDFLPGVFKIPAAEKVGAPCNNGNCDFRNTFGIDMKTCRVCGLHMQVESKPCRECGAVYRGCSNV